MLWLAAARLRNRLTGSIAVLSALVVLVLIIVLHAGATAAATPSSVWQELALASAGAASIVAAVARGPAFSRAHDDVLAMAGFGVWQRAFVGVVEEAATRLPGVVLIGVLAAAGGNGTILVLFGSMTIVYGAAFGALRTMNTVMRMRAPVVSAAVACAQGATGAILVALAAAHNADALVTQAAHILGHGGNVAPRALGALIGMASAAIYLSAATQIGRIPSKGAVALAQAHLSRVTRSTTHRLCAGSLLAACGASYGAAGLATQATTLLVVGVVTLSAFLAPAPWRRWYALPLCYNAQPDARASIAALAMADVLTWLMPLVPALSIETRIIDVGLIVSVAAACIVSRMLAFAVEAFTADTTLLAPLTKASLMALLIGLAYAIYSVAPAPLFILGETAIVVLAGAASVTVVARALGGSTIPRRRVSV